MGVKAALSLKYLCNVTINSDDNIIVMVDFNIHIHKDRCQSHDKSTIILSDTFSKTNLIS